MKIKILRSLNEFLKCPNAINDLRPPSYLASFARGRSPIVNKLFDFAKPGQKEGKKPRYLFLLLHSINLCVTLLFVEIFFFHLSFIFFLPV